MSVGVEVWILVYLISSVLIRIFSLTRLFDECYANFPILSQCFSMVKIPCTSLMTALYDSLSQAVPQYEEI